MPPLRKKIPPPFTDIFLHLRAILISPARSSFPCSDFLSQRLYLHVHSLLQLGVLLCRGFLQLVFHLRPSPRPRRSPLMPALGSTRLPLPHAIRPAERFFPTARPSPHRDAPVLLIHGGSSSCARLDLPSARRTPQLPTLLAARALPAAAIPRRVPAPAPVPRSSRARVPLMAVALPSG
jgi:hypothetical protein